MLFPVKNWVLLYDGGSTICPICWLICLCPCAKDCADCGLKCIITANCLSSMVVVSKCARASWSLSLPLATVAWRIWRIYSYFGCCPAAASRLLLWLAKKEKFAGYSKVCAPSSPTYSPSSTSARQGVASRKWGMIDGHFFQCPFQVAPFYGHTCPLKTMMRRSAPLRTAQLFICSKWDALVWVHTCI